MARSVKANFIYSLINTVSGFVFPLITFPYVSRILQADGIGEVNFYNSIINYVILLTGLGIPVYGIREIAKVRDKKNDLEQTLAEILSLHLILNVIGYVAIFAICIFIDQIGNAELFLLLSLTLFLNTIGCGWFYSGVEDFKYIAVRSIIVRTISVILLFLLVRDKQDLIFYGVYNVFVSGGSNILNFFRLRNYISLNELKKLKLNLIKHIKPASSIFILNLITSIYINLDKVMLGFIKGSTAVGYYTSASQISHILLTAVSVLGSVMLPRASNLIQNNNIEEFFRLSEKSYHFILLLSLPIALGCIALAPDLIYLFCSSSYEPAINTLRLLAPVVIAIGMSNQIGMQILYPLGKVKLITISTGVGALTNIVLNLLLIPILAQNGAAIATLCAEFSVTITQIVITREIIPYKFISVKNFKYLGAAIIMLFVCLFLKYLNMSSIVNIIVIPIVGAISYVTFMLITNDYLTKEIVSIIIFRSKK